MNEGKFLKILIAVAETEASQIAGVARSENCRLFYVHAAQELLAFRPFPDLILLDLELESCGMKTLRLIKEHPRLHAIPLIALVHLQDGKIADEAYELGASSCILKPASLHDYEKLLGDLEHYWLEVAKLPNSALS